MGRRTDSKGGLVPCLRETGMVRASIAALGRDGTRQVNNISVSV